MRLQQLLRQALQCSIVRQWMSMLLLIQQCRMVQQLLVLLLLLRQQCGRNPQGSFILWMSQQRRKSRRPLSLQLAQRCQQLQPPRRLQPSLQLPMALRLSQSCSMTLQQV
jgi:hypothetical protein